MSREYKVERVAIKKEYYNAIIEADSEREAIEKVKNLKISDSMYQETSSQEEWIAKRHRESFWETVKNMFHSV